MKNLIEQILAALALATVIGLFVLVVIFLNSCGPAMHTVQCTEAYEHIDSMRCADFLSVPGEDGVYDTPDDIPWPEWCVWVQESNVDVLDTDCFMSSETCEQVEQCVE